MKRRVPAAISNGNLSNASFGIINGNVAIAPQGVMSLSGAFDLRVMRDLFHIFDIFQTYANRTIMAILRYFSILTFVSLRTAFVILGSVLGSIALLFITIIQLISSK